MKLFWYDFEYVEERLINSIVTIEAMPNKEMGYLRSGTCSQMPETLKEKNSEYYDDFLEDVGVSVKLDTTRLNDITQKGIDMAYESMGWTLHAEPKERKIIGAVIRMKMVGIDPPRWGVIQKKFAPGCRSRQTVINRYKRGIGRIVDELNKKIHLTYWTD